MARLLLDHGVDPNIKRNDLWSSLHLASANGQLKVAGLLVQRGASVDVSNDKQETPLYRAVMNRNTVIDRLLIDHGATALCGQQWLDYIACRVATWASWSCKAVSSAGC
jgi:ankyrin repeat protein